MLTCIHQAMHSGVKVLECDEAVLLCMNENFFDNHTGQDVKSGEYLAIQKAFSYDIFGAEVYRSTKGSFSRTKKAFERYSPEFMKEMEDTAAAFPCHF